MGGGGTYVAPSVSITNSTFVGTYALYGVRCGVRERSGCDGCPLVGLAGCAASALEHNMAAGGAILVDALPSVLFGGLLPVTTFVAPSVYGPHPPSVHRCRSLGNRACGCVAQQSH